MELYATDSGRQQQPLVDRVESAVRHRTTGVIRGLRVEMIMGELVLSGRAPTYYAKQLATHAALEMCDNLSLDNQIEVR